MRVEAAPAPRDSTGDPGQPGSPRCAWERDEGGWRLVLGGDWRGAGRQQPLPPIEPVPPELASPPRPLTLAVDPTALQGWDARLASALWQRLAAIDRRRVTIDLDALPPGLRQILGLALPPLPAPAALPAPEAAVATAAAGSSLPAPPAAATTADHAPAAGTLAAALHDRLPPWVTRVGQRAAATAERIRTTFDFIGAALLALARLLRGKSDMRWSDFAWQLDQTGPRSVPIVLLVSFLVGLIVAYMGADQLQRFGAQAFIADLVTVGVVREIAALLVGIVLAGRVGAAFAAQLGSMRANEEVDALQTIGIDAIDHLVLPRVLALTVVGPLLTAFAALVGMAAGWLVAVAIFGVTPLEYGYKSLRALSLAHVLIGLSKGTVYALLVALAGCRQGLAAGRSAQAVGDAATAAVVQAIVWMVIAASVMTVTFQRLQW